MTNAMEIESNKGISGLSALLCITSVVHAPGEGDGQKWPSASAGIAVGAVITPQPW
jgi:hypothetical protein